MKKAKKKEAAPDKGRAKGSGWLVKRGAFWTACWKYNGKLFKKSTGTANKRDAEAKLKILTAPYRAARNEHDAEAGVSKLRDTAQRSTTATLADLPVLTVGQFRDGFARTNGAEDKTPATMRGFNSSIGDFAKWATKIYGPQLELRNVSADMARNFMAHKYRQCTAPQTRQHICARLAVAWATLKKEDDEHAAEVKQSAKVKRVTQEREEEPEGNKATLGEWGGLPYARLGKLNPFESAKVKAKPRNGEDNATEHREPFTDKDVADLIRTATGEMQLLVRLGARFGMRLGDACTIKFGDHIRLHDGQTGRLRFSPRKTAGRSRRFVDTALGEELKAILAALPQSAEEGAYVLPELAKLYLKNESAVSYRFRALMIRAGIDPTRISERGTCGRQSRAKLGFHSLRYRLAKKLGAKAAQEQLGHSTATTTRGYANEGKDTAQREREAAELDIALATSEAASAAARLARFMGMVDEMVENKDDLREARAYLAKACRR